MTELRGKRVLLREWRWSDEDDLVRLAGDRDIWRNLRDRFAHPYTHEAAQAWLTQAIPHGVGTNFVVEVAGQFAGGCALHPQEDVYRHSAEVGYWLGRPFWGQGLATEAIQTLSAYAFAQFDFARLFAGVFAWNPASCRVLEKSGFVLEGRLRNAVFKDGVLVDQLMYGRLRDRT